MLAPLAATSRETLVDRFRRGRLASRRFFDGIPPESYTAKPIPLRHPFCFYEGHLAAFNVNTLLKGGLGQPGIDAGFETLFERGIDPSDLQAAAAFERTGWPSRRAILAYVEKADEAVVRALREEDLERTDRPSLRRGEAVFNILEHEFMHQETLRYIAHRLPYDSKSRPVDYQMERGGEAPPFEEIRVPAGRATLGAERDRIPFGWDNEFPSLSVEVPAFAMDRHDVTNQDFLKFLEAGGYDDESLWTPEDWAWRQTEQITHPIFWERCDGGWNWRGMFEPVPLPAAWPVYVSGAEAAAFARFKKRRLPTEAEFHRAAYGTPGGKELAAPWGDEPALPARGNFGMTRPDPVPVGSRPAGRSVWGIEDLVGNGWEWTSSDFAPFPGFTPMASYPIYSVEFFDGSHRVILGASPATHAELLRPSLRNWFRPNYQYLYATFRTVRSTEKS